MFEKLFKLSKFQTSVKTEGVAGLTTFMTMAYILAVNPNILSAAGMDYGAVFTATALASAIACFCMAFFANKPLALSAGMGLNAYFAFTVCGAMGFTWPVALTAILIEGLIFILLSVTNIREAIFNAIPKNLKIAVTVGIGLFIAFIGMQNSHIIVDGPTLVTLFSFKEAFATGTFNSEGISVILTLLGVLLTSFLLIKGVRGYMLYGIVGTWIVGVVCQLLGLYVPNPETGFFSLIPSAIFSIPASVSPTFMKFDFSFISARPLDFLTVILAFLFVDVFDTLGTVIGCAAKANLLDEDGKLPGIRGVLLADAIGTTLGACLGTSTITTFVESSSGISEGGRTGLTACTTGLLFLVAMFFWPVFAVIPSFATAPALIVVGFLMIQQVVHIDWENMPEAIPCFITIATMAFSYSISEGISFGIISYVVLHLLTGKTNKLNALMYILSIVFIIKYIWL